MELLTKALKLSGQICPRQQQARLLGQVTWLRSWSFLSPSVFVKAMDMVQVSAQCLSMCLTFQPCVCDLPHGFAPELWKYLRSGCCGLLPCEEAGLAPPVGTVLDARGTALL